MWPQSKDKKNEKCGHRAKTKRMKNVATEQRQKNKKCGHRAKTKE